MLGGSSIKDFSSSSGKKRAFQQHFSVYGKKGEECSTKLIVRVRIKKNYYIKSIIIFTALNVKNNKVDHNKSHIYTIKKCQILNQQSEE